ncbi:DUF6655 family protein [uncultured Rubinisphaera sp.]|uniref:DUF6655 family protein n=1 Tax=Rubinisphaera sp. TaxID=2024857 RepID=UPI0030D93BC1
MFYSFCYPCRSLFPLVVICLVLSGCGKSMVQNGTEQLLTSDAVDRVVAQIDFTPLSGQKVYFQDQYIKDIKGIGFVNGDYIISSLRQQILAANCKLEEKAEQADYIIEARVGALGNDQHEVSYGIPASNVLSSVSALNPATPPIPAIPEISFAKKKHQIGAAKIGVFAYHRESKEPVWQAGVKSSRSRSKESWFLGVGPLQSGTIYDGPMFAGAKIKRPIYQIFSKQFKQPEPQLPPVQYKDPHMFPIAKRLEQERQIEKIQHPNSDIQWAGHDENSDQIKQLVEQASQLKPAEEKPAEK